MVLFHRVTNNASKNSASARVGEAVVQIAREGSQSTVTVAGRVTVDSSPHLRSALLGLIRKSPGGVFVIDVSAVTHIDTSGLATLLEVLNSARGHSIRIRLVGISGQPRRLAELTELQQIFRTSGSEVEFR
jgi:anti-sigma B factor antagonist